MKANKFNIQPLNNGLYRLLLPNKNEYIIYDYSIPSYNLFAKNFLIIELYQNRYNILTIDGYFAFVQQFKSITDKHYYFLVENFEGKFNLVDEYLNLVFENWLNAIHLEKFKHLCVINLNDKYNIYDLKKRKLLFENEWFDFIDIDLKYDGSFVYVTKNNKNYLKNLLTNEELEVDYCYQIENDIAFIGIGKSVYVINYNMKKIKIKNLKTEKIDYDYTFVIDEKSKNNKYKFRYDIYTSDWTTFKPVKIYTIYFDFRQKKGGVLYNFLRKTKN